MGVCSFEVVVANLQNSFYFCIAIKILSPDSILSQWWTSSHHRRKSFKGSESNPSWIPPYTQPFLALHNVRTLAALIHQFLGIVQWHSHKLVVSGLASIIEMALGMEVEHIPLLVPRPWINHRSLEGVRRAPKIGA